jgi:hypothetical protein
MRVNPQVRREAELFTDGRVTDDLLHAMACAHGLPLHRVPTTFEARPKRGYDVESLRALVRVAERRRDDALRQVMDAERELMRWQDALTAALDRQAREQR